VLNLLHTISRGVRDIHTTRVGAGVPVSAQLAQLALVRAGAGVGRAEYFKYRLWRPGLSTVERLCYTSQRERKRSEAVTNRRQGREHRGGKSVINDRLSAGGIPGPELLGLAGHRPHDAIRTVADLGDCFVRHGTTALVIKPERGKQGDNILVGTEADRSGITLLSGSRMSTEEVWQHLARRMDSGWRLERWVRPDPLVAGWRPGATPTIRMLTLVVGDAVVVHAATIKVPVGDSGVDNLAKGNLVAEVDLRTGITGPATDSSGQSQHHVHPHSGHPIAGITIPHWQRYLDMATTGAAVLLPDRAIGWDVAVAEHGPVVLEANAKWCEKLVQLPSGRGVTRGAFIRLLHEVGAGGLLARRRRLSRGWRTYEQHALEGAE
jgi:hypothetical protein